MLNTALLLTSGFYATIGLHSSTMGDDFGYSSRMALSISLRVLFTFFEYAECSFSIMSGTFGSIFFLATRFHRAHVFIGTSFLVASFFRGFFGEFSSGARIVGLLACIWY
jgi:cytochrome c oxidase subunit 3